MADNSEVIVIGAGIVGASVGYHLANLGADVTMIEQTHPAGGPTGKSSALTHAFYLSPELSQLSIRGWQLLEQLPELSGGHSFVSKVGMMWICGDDMKDAWLEAAERIRAEGSVIEALSPDEFHKMAPHFSRDGIALALWEPDYGYADAFGATNAIATAAREKGAKLLQNTPVQRLVSEDGKITGVELADGRILSANHIVLAAGPWTNRLLSTVGLDLPIYVERHPMAVLEAEGRARTIMPFAWCDDLNRNYARPDNDGVILAGTWAGGGTGVRHADVEDGRRVENPDDYMEGMTEDESVNIVETFEQRVPAMLELGIRPGYAGLYDMSPDDMPIIGAMPGVEGLIVSAGSSGHGFKTGPAVGEAIAKLILEGEQAVLAPFTPARFF